MTRLSPGDAAPPFELLNQESKPVALADFAGQKLLVYFYPKADTSGCTKQACSVRDALPDLSGAGIAAVGISTDKPQAQERFARKYGLGFPLLSDADHAIAATYGVWGEKSMYGKTYMGIIRSAFLVDQRGTIQEAWYKISPADTVPRVLAAARPAKRAR